MHLAIAPRSTIEGRLNLARASSGSSGPAEVKPPAQKALGESQFAPPTLHC